MKGHYVLDCWCETRKLARIQRDYLKEAGIKRIRIENDYENGGFKVYGWVDV